MTHLRPRILKLGNWTFSEKQWSTLSQIADVVECDSPNREQFIKDLKGKYSQITNIARTFSSVKQTGRFDAELAVHFPPSLVSISHNGAGYDQIDPDPFTERGIQLSNVTVPVEGPTALTAVYLTLAAMRRFQEGHNLLLDGKFPTGKAAGVGLGHDPDGKTVGIIGMGGIGRAIRDRLLPFGFAKFLYYNRSQLSKDLEGVAEYASFDDLLAKSDVVLVSVPLNPKTHHLINKDAFGKMKDGVVIVNTARGAVIDETELLAQLKLGKVGAFGSDVFEHEPEVPQELLDLPNVVSLPHMGTHTSEALTKMEEFVIDNVRSCIETGKVKTIVPEQAKVEFKTAPLV